MTAPSYGTTTAPVLVSGTGTAGLSLTLYDGTTAIGTTTVLADNTWSFSLTFAVGTHTLTAKQSSTGTIKYTSDASDPDVLKVYAPPAAPTITAPATSGSALLLSGTGVAGNWVVVTEAGGLSWTTQVLGNGTWTLAVPLTLTLGNHVFSARQSEPSSGATSVASASVTVRIVAVPTAPAITVSTPVPGIISTVTVDGTGTAGDTITIYDGTTVIKTLTLTTTGAWSTTVSLWYGPHSLSATRTAGGLVSNRGAAVSVVVALR
jgi:hypothetical protein